VREGKGRKTFTWMPAEVFPSSIIRYKPRLLGDDSDSDDDYNDDVYRIDRFICFSYYDSAHQARLIVLAI
jgi:hypothetical protein